jgi:hypothetical protein
MSSVGSDQPTIGRYHGTQLPDTTLHMDGSRFRSFNAGLCHLDCLVRIGMNASQQVEYFTGQHIAADK